MLWSFEGIGIGYSSVSIADGKIYTTGMADANGIMTCLDLNGQQLWQANYGPEWKRNFKGARCTPTIDNGSVYVISGVGQVGCFDADTGQKNWLIDAFSQFEGRYPHWGYAESPLVLENKIIFTVGGEKVLMAAVNIKDGSVVWTTPANGDRSAFCSPIAFQWADKTIIATVTENYILGVNAHSGELLFSYPISNYVTGNFRPTHPNTPIANDGKIFVSSGYDIGAIQLRLSEDGTSVEQVWTNPEFDNHHGCIVLLDGKLYGANWQSNKVGKWMCVDWQTGKTEYEILWGNKGGLTCADDMLYCYEEASGTVGLVKPENFEVVSSFPITLGENEHWARPVVCGKRFYIRHGDVLMAFDIAG